MTPKDFFTSLEDQQASIENIVSKRKRFLAGNAGLIIDLEAAAREDAEEKELTLRRWIELTARWIGRPSSIWLASTFLTT